jgi:hypothetical protein
VEQNWGFFGDDLVAFKPVPGACLAVTGYHPHTGHLRWNTAHSRVSGNVWVDQANKEPCLAASVDGNNDPCREWTFIDPRRDRLAWRTPASTCPSGKRRQAPARPGEILIGLTGGL